MTPPIIVHTPRGRKAAPPGTIKYTVMLAPGDQRDLGEIAQRLGATWADALRTLIRREVANAARAVEGCDACGCMRAASSPACCADAEAGCGDGRPCAACGCAAGPSA